MDVIKVRRFGIAWGMTFTIIYVSSIILFLIAGHEGVVFVLNSIIHGVDFSSILRHDMAASEMTIGIVEVFVIGYLMGATIASIYNFHFVRFDNQARPMNMNM